MKNIIILLAFVLVSSIGNAEVDKIESLADNGIPILGIDFSESGDVGVCWGGDGSVWKTVDKINWVPAISICFESLKNVEAINIFTFIAITNSHVFLTRNGGGGAWENITNRFPIGTIFTKVKYTNQCIYILGKNGKVFKSLDLGVTWINNSLDEPSDPVDIAFFSNIDTGYLISSDPFHPLWFTTNGGEDWESQSIHQDLVGKCIAISGEYVYIAGFGDMQNGFPEPLLIRVYEGGWEAVPLPESYVPVAIDVKGANGVLITQKTQSLFAKTFDTGNSWSFQEQDLRHYSVAIVSNWLYTTSDSGTIYRTQLQLTGIQPIVETPEKYNLSQNYPNPFNPSTKINFSIPKSGKVKLAVYNTAGKEVAVLIDQSLSAGNYTADFDATNLTSGVYFYTLQSESFIQRKKMVLIK